MVNFTKITPNIISIFSLAFGLLSAFFYFTGEIFFAGFAYLISYIFDATDGKVARIKKIGKVYGSWFDIFVDRCNLLLISSAISYNYFVLYDDIIFVILNTFFLGIAFIGWESRYNIDIYKFKNDIRDNQNYKESRYEKWCKDRGLIKDPISLPEIFLYYFIIVPHLSETVSFFSLIFIILLLCLRVFKQQTFWINVINK